MKRIIFAVVAMIWFMVVYGETYSYKFNATPLSEAFSKIAEDNPEITLNFIYNELDKYKTSANISTDNVYDALRQIIGLNPVSVIKKGDRYFVEALQHGKFCYSGKVVGIDKQPVVAATVMLLAPKDSTVITYGITDDTGRFNIPCDKESVIAKISSLGYKTLYKRCDTFALGTIIMMEMPVRLQSIKVAADEAAFYSDKSVYRPTQRQKNASQTATDLLARMAIPQLDVRLGSSSVSTVSGQPVAIYIDYVPANSDELKMMRMSDVRSVEYFENPMDPRFQGNRNVVNFIMVKYEYGGYVKALANEKFIANTGFMQGNARFVRKKMTYDIMGYGYYIHNDHVGIDQTETFRFPQEDGNMVDFRRESLTEASKYRKQNYQTSLRALYSGDKVTANNQFSLGMENTPHNDITGSVIYSDNLLRKSNYNSTSISKEKYLNYNGYYFFNLPKSNTVTASLEYQYSHTNQSSLYLESDNRHIYNAANDNTHNCNVIITYNKTFSKKNSIRAFTRGLFEHNRTDYSGSVNVIDYSITRYGQIGASYNFKTSRISGSCGFGWCWIATKLNEKKSFADFPYVDASIRFVPNNKNSLDAIFHYSVWPPSSNYKSENIIQVSPFLFHTGNPMLKSYRCYDIGIHYNIVPNRKFWMSVFGISTLWDNRAAFVYVPTENGIIRTIQQPIGSFRNIGYGIQASTSQLDGRLYFSGRIQHSFIHNDIPFNSDKSFLNYNLQALYYLGNFNFVITYQSVNYTSAYDSTSGIWGKGKDNFIIQAGWGDASWNLLIAIQNFQRWNWKTSHETLNTEYYSFNKYNSGALSHALVQVSATYTFGYGKKINRDNDINKHSGASSGILK